VGAYYSFLALSVFLFGAELWAGAFALASCALLVNASAPAENPARRRTAFVWAAAAAALAAALVRELGIAFVLLGLVATLADAEDRTKRLWMPWAGALAITLVVYAVHWSAARAAVASLHLTAVAHPVAWLHPDGRGLVAAVTRIGFLMALRTTVAWLLVAVAALGAIVGIRRTDARIMLGGSVIGGCAVLLVVNPGGVTYGVNIAPSYWGDMVAATVLACIPLALALVPAARREPLAPESEPGTASPRT